jgi:putative NADH-flavin reductase
MNAPAAGQNLVIVGASGMVGGYALRYALDHPAVERVTAIGRKTLGISHPKLMDVLHRDFADCSALAAALSGQDAAVFCLGAYTGGRRTLSSARSPWTTPSSSRAFSAAAALMPSLDDHDR